MRPWSLALVAAVVLLALVAVLYPVYTSPVRDDMFSAYDDDWNDLSELKDALERDTRSVVTSPLMLEDVEHREKAVLFIVGMEKKYSDLEVDAVEQFVNDGGKLVLATSNELANPISERFGVRFYSDAVLDPAFMTLDVRNMSIYEHNATLMGENYTIRFNSPVGLEAEAGVEVLCQSSSNSSLDLNGNGLRDLSDKRGPIPLIAMSRRNSNGGMAVFVSCPSVFVNQEIQKAGNLNFTLDLVDYLLDWNQEGSTDTVVGGGDAGEPLIIFEESRHVSTRDRQVVYNMITLLTYLSKHPILIAVVLINILCIGLFWWLANPRPKPFRHVDRLDDVNPRDTSWTTEQLREALILKMLDSKPIQKDHTILSSDDLKERLAEMPQKKVRQLLGDEDLAALALGNNVKNVQGLKKKVLRWEHNDKRNGK